MRVDTGYIYETNKKSIDELIRMKWIGGFYTIGKKWTGGKLLLIDNCWDQIIIHLPPRLRIKKACQ